jgi:hypothetical protein
LWLNDAAGPGALLVEHCYRKLSIVLRRTVELSRTAKQRRRK